MRKKLKNLIGAEGKMRSCYTEVEKSMLYIRDQMQS